MFFTAFTFHLSPFNSRCIVGPMSVHCRSIVGPFPIHEAFFVPPWRGRRGAVVLPLSSRDGPVMLPLLTNHKFSILNSQFSIFNFHQSIIQRRRHGSFHHLLLSFSHTDCKPHSAQASVSDGFLSQSSGFGDSGTPVSRVRLALIRSLISISDRTTTAIIINARSAFKMRNC